MKKVISLLLAILMVFSVTTVAFAAEDSTGAPIEDAETTTAATTVPETEVTREPTDVENNITQYLEQLQLKLGLKVGKIVVKVLIKLVMVGLKLGIINVDTIKGWIGDFTGSGEETPAPEVSESAVETTPVAEAA